MNISFGAKIPIYQNQVFNKATQKFEDATLYEIDCKDESDIEYIDTKVTVDYFKSDIRRAVVEKFDQYNCAKRNPRDFRYYANKDRVYVLEAKDGRNIGICETNEPNNKVTNIEYIASKNNKYKYAGIAMIGDIAKEARNKKMNYLTVEFPVTNAEDFYKSGCGFRGKAVDGFYMEDRDLDIFAKHVEEKTHAPIIDLRV